MLLLEPQRSPKLAQQLQAALFDLLTAQPAAAAASAGTSLLSPLAQGATRRPGQPGSLFGYLVSGRQGVGGAMRYTFFPKHLPRPARVALEQGRPGLVPPLFSARLQQQNAQAPNQGYGGASPPAAGAPPAEALLVLSGWEYQLFCFCLWPLNDEGASLLEALPPPPAAPLSAQERAAP